MTLGCSILRPFTKYFTGRLLTRPLSTTTNPASNEEINQIPPNIILRPSSPSYFTDKPAYHDTLLALQDLVNAHQTLPRVLPDNIPRPSWLPADRLRNLIGVELKSSQYRQILQLLNRLYSIDPVFVPMSVKATLETFMRPENATKSGIAERTLDKYGRAYAIGRRKEASARVWVVNGEGLIMINGKPPTEYFQRIVDADKVNIPFRAIEQLSKFNVWAIVNGGGPTGQCEAVIHAITKALIIHNKEWKPVLRKTGYVTRDPRVVERKKPGQAKARKKYTWVKR